MATFEQLIDWTKQHPIYMAGWLDSREELIMWLNLADTSKTSEELICDLIEYMIDSKPSGATKW